MTQAAIYHYFESKEEVLFDVIQKFGNEVFFRLRAVAQKHVDPLERLKNVILEHVLLIRSKGGKGGEDSDRGQEVLEWGPQGPHHE